MNKSRLLKKILGSVPRCFLTIDRNFRIIEISYGVERFAEIATMVFYKNDVRHAFPELIGLESAFADIWNDSGQTLELKGIMRGHNDETPIYFDLYAVLSDEDQENKIMFIYLEDVTNIMIKSQSLMQRVNEIELFFSVLSSSKEYIECILNSMADALIVTNQSHRIKIANPAALDLFGYTKDELVYHYIDQLIVDVEQLKILHKNATQITTGDQSNKDDLIDRNRCNLEINCLTKDQKQVLIAFSCAQIWIEKEKSYNYIYIGRDVTLIHEKEALLRQAKQQAEYSSQAKSIFLANMSHEIRTPMNGVLGMADLLAETQLTAEQKFLVDGIRLSGNILLDLINDILDLAKLEAGQENIALTTFDIHSSLEEILEIFALRAHQKGLEINSIIDPSIPRYLLGDPHHLRHILINLVGNALKFTNEGNILIKLEWIQPKESSSEISTNTTTENTENIEDPEQIISEKAFPDSPEKATPSKVTVLFSVIDTGIGIPNHAIANLFKPFSQVDASTTRRFGGTGLGLSICKQLIDLMGGKFGVKHNTEDLPFPNDAPQPTGSHFWFELSFDLPPAPNLYLNQSNPSLDKSFEPRSIQPLLKPLPNCPIVIISPHAYSQEALVNQLQMQQVSVIKIVEAPEAFAMMHMAGYGDTYILHQLQKLELPTPPLAVLIDFDLLYQKTTNQKIVNLGLVRQIQNIPPLGNVPIISMIRVNQQEHNIALLQAGCTNYLVKPFNQKRITTLLNDLFNNSINNLTADHQGNLSQNSPTSSQNVPSRPSTTSLTIVPEPNSLNNNSQIQSRNSKNLAIVPDLSPIKTLKILVAEDNKVNQMVVTKQLERYVARLDVVPDGQKAVTAWQDQDYDLILMDCQMPVMDGYEAAKTIRQKEQEQQISQPVVIIAMTANAMAEDRERCLQSGMNDYLSKPLRTVQLTEMLQRWSGRLRESS